MPNLTRSVPSPSTRLEIMPLFLRSGCWKGAEAVQGLRDTLVSVYSHPIAVVNQGFNSMYGCV